MADITQTSFAGAVKTFYNTTLLMRAQPRLLHTRWGMKAKLNKFGSLEWRRYGQYSAVITPLTEGTTPTEQAAPSLTQITSTPLFYGAWVGFSDEIEMTSIDAFVTEVTGILGDQAGLSVDTIVRDVITAGVSKMYSNGKSARNTLDAPGDDVTYRDIVMALATLYAANALPMEGGVFPVSIHPHSIATLMQDPQFTNVFVAEASREAMSPLRSGYIGRFLMCDFYMSSNVREYTNLGYGGTTDVYSMTFYGQQAYGVSGIGAITPKDVDNQGVEGLPGTGGKFPSPVEVIPKQLGSAGSDDALNQRATLGWKVSLDAEITQSVFALDLEHTNAFSDL